MSLNPLVKPAKTRSAPLRIARRDVFAAAFLMVATGLAAHAETLGVPQRLAKGIFQELVDINTVSETGDTGRAADAMAARLRAEGFSGSDVQVFKPSPRKGNLVARLRGSGTRKPILLLAHMDVVPANPEDWSLDPFKFIEKDGYFYGRGTSDDKAMAANLISNLIRYKREGYKPDRDIIVALTADEEIGGRWGVQWLVKNQRELIDAEFALNEGGGVTLRNGKPFRVNIQTAEKITVNFRLEVTNKGGHSSLPTPDNAIYRLAEGLSRLAKFSFPVNLNPTTRASFESIAEIESPRTAGDIRSVLSDRPDPAALSRLSANTAYNAQLRTTCVPTLLEGGQAANALPQAARATINCRILPGEATEDVRTALVRALADDQISVAHPAQAALPAPSDRNEELWSAIEKTAAEFWPGTPVVPVMVPGSTDGRFLRDAGIPTYGHTGLASGEVSAHGKDERVMVTSFLESGEYLYRLVKRLSERR
ncbi:M20/M25/M40 family metallo-hydrolase [Bradyrhizobium jicamae]|uniref:M20/M25/M40 family metallo-hydrolase n=1 Tax=Bradyrhizobium jicamae TaxID=280332 RepID=A0ABS5FWX8_9BRAD|nr:M20/M25/M40 family metallo-hydrolase [Bradyrhizobium jicamae]MBR0801236.1 M20/M25/M40 family metallo-hydrolase [Bradyrhizobium jicamae]